MASNHRDRYWNKFVGADGTWRIAPGAKQPKRPPGEDLAALRAGLGREAGTVPEMWRFYTCEIDDRLARQDRVSQEQEAEHAALALYGLHQQSQDRPMHAPRVTLGHALRELRRSGKFSEQAVDARVEAAVTTTNVPALLMRLRGLITQLRTISQPLDYDQLMDDIKNWNWPDSRQRVIRRWGLGYYAWSQQAKDETSESLSSEAS
jgi:CRISPR system Cascade subunit CasB